MPPQPENGTQKKINRGAFLNDIAAFAGFQNNALKYKRELKEKFKTFAPSEEIYNRTINSNLWAAKIVNLDLMYSRTNAEKNINNEWLVKAIKLPFIQSIIVKDEDPDEYTTTINVIPNSEKTEAKEHLNAHTINIKKIDLTGTNVADQIKTLATEYKFILQQWVEGKNTDLRLSPIADNEPKITWEAITKAVNQLESATTLKIIKKMGKHTITMCTRGYDLESYKKKYNNGDTTTVPPPIQNERDIVDKELKKRVKKRDKSDLISYFLTLPEKELRFYKNKFEIKTDLNDIDTTNGVKNNMTQAARTTLLNEEKNVNRFAKDKINPKFGKFRNVFKFAPKSIPILKTIENNIKFYSLFENAKNFAEKSLKPYSENQKEIFEKAILAVVESNEKTLTEQMFKSYTDNRTINPQLIVNYAKARLNDNAVRDLITQLSKNLIETKKPSNQDLFKNVKQVKPENNENENGVSESEWKDENTDPLITNPENNEGIWVPGSQKQKVEQETSPSRRLEGEQKTSPKKPDNSQAGMGITDPSLIDALSGRRPQSDSEEESSSDDDE